MSAVHLDAPTPALAHPAPKLALAAAVSLIGDRLFYGHSLGISVALFMALIATAAWLADRRAIGGRDRMIALLCLASGLAPLVETVDIWSLTSGALGLALFCAITIGGAAQGVRAVLASACHTIGTSPVALASDLYDIARRGRYDGCRPRVATVLGWVVPVVLCGVFAGLFAAANPLIGVWVADIPWAALVPSFDPPRILLWGALLAVVWALIVPRVRRRRRSADEAAGRPSPPATTTIGRLFDTATILRCLVLFNLLFAVQSATDVAFLWGGLDLPHGVTYAAYAHRGAYPLVATALLAAAFVLVALCPGGAGERSRAIRSLVYLWIGQNVLLVASAMLRLDLYVATYSLTLPRVAALIWMALIAVGLVLIVARIAFRRSNGWLIGANGVALALTLYVCAFVNFAGLVATYNAAHGSGAGQPFDLAYAMNLGAEAIPAIDRVLADRATPPTPCVASWRAERVSELRSRSQDWRAWTFRDRRLLAYIEAHPGASVPNAAIDEERSGR